MMIRRLLPGDGMVLGQLRLAALRDAPESFSADLTDLENETPKGWESRLAIRAAFAAHMADAAIGLASYIRNQSGHMAHRAHLVNVWLAPEHRGRGLAEALDAHVEHEARDADVLQLELEVNAENARAVAFYTRLGYTEVGRMPRAFRQGSGFVDDLIMVKQID